MVSDHSAGGERNCGKAVGSRQTLRLGPGRTEFIDLPIGRYSLRRQAGGRIFAASHGFETCAYRKRAVTHKHHRP